MQCITKTLFVSCWMQLILLRCLAAARFFRVEGGEGALLPVRSAPARVRAPARLPKLASIPAREPGPAAGGRQAVRLETGAPVEVWLSGELALGNFRGPVDSARPGGALRVELAEGGEVATVAAEQLVDVWPGAAPASPAAWRSLTKETTALLASLPPPRTDLAPLAKRIASVRGHRLDTARAAGELWTSRTGKAPSLAQRAAAGRLLAADRTLFKRRPAQVEADDEGLVLTGGGFRALSRAQAQSLGETQLVQQLRARRDAGGSQAPWPAPTLALLAELERTASGSAEPSKAARRVLRELGVEASPAGARALLLDVGQWVADEPEDGAPGRDFEAFPPAALAAAKDVAAGIEQRRRDWDAEEPPPYPELYAGGLLRYLPRMPAIAVSRQDLRGLFPRAYAIDMDNTEFRDDAFSYDLQTRTLAVHIVDAAAAVPDTHESALDEVARLRLQTQYDGSQPLHMLPPPLLKALGLSKNSPNECVSAVMEFDAGGKLRRSTLVRSVIPPVRSLTFEEVSALFKDNSFSSVVHDDFKGLLALLMQRRRWRKVSKEEPQQQAALQPMKWRQRTDGSWRPEVVSKTAAHQVVGDVLSLFTYIAWRFARAANLPLLPQMEDMRIGTAPLRRYADLVAQRQLTAVLDGRAPGSASEMEATSKWIRRKAAERASSKRAQPEMLRLLETQEARQAWANGEPPMLDGVVIEITPAANRSAGANATATGMDVHVRLRVGGGRIVAVASASTPAHERRAQKLKLGQAIKVRLRSVDAQRGSVEVSLI